MGDCSIDRDSRLLNDWLELCFDSKDIILAQTRENVCVDFGFRILESEFKNGADCRTSDRFVDPSVHCPVSELRNARDQDCSGLKTRTDLSSGWLTLGTK
jgi:hypothetical protein